MVKSLRINSNPLTVCEFYGKLVKLGNEVIQETVENHIKEFKEALAEKDKSSRKNAEKLSEDIKKQYD